MKKFLIIFCLGLCLIGQSSTMSKIQIGDDVKTVKNRLYTLTILSESPGRVTFNGNPDVNAISTTVLFGNDHVISMIIQLKKAMTKEEAEKIFSDVKDWVITFNREEITFSKPNQRIYIEKKKPAFNKEKSL